MMNHDLRYNPEYVAPVEGRCFDKYSEAVEYAEGAFWVEPIFFAPTDRGERAQDRFEREFSESYPSQNGLVHYRRAR